MLVNGEPAQVVGPGATAELRIATFAHLPADAREQGALDHIRAVSEQPFRLDHAPLARFDLACLGEADQILAITLHHLVADGWSLRLLLAEIVTCYAAQLSSSRPALRPLSVQYADYAVWQRRQLESGGVIAQQVEYWRSQLDGMSHALDLPTDRPRPAMATYAGAEHVFSLRPDLVRQVTDLGRTERATQFMTLLAVFQLLLARYCGADDIVVGTPTAGLLRLEPRGPDRLLHQHPRDPIALLWSGNLP